MTTATARNRYYRRSRLGETKFRVIVRCFATDLTATDTASLTGISVRSIDSIFLRIRRRKSA
jgi:transposase